MSTPLIKFNIHLTLFVFEWSLCICIFSVLIKARAQTYWHNKVLIFLFIVLSFCSTSVASLHSISTFHFSMYLVNFMKLQQNNFSRHVEKVMTNAENEMRVASSVLKLCITSVNPLTIGKAQLPHTFWIQKCLYENFTTTELHYGNQALLTVLLPWMLLDPQLLTWLHETRLWIPQKLHFVNMSFRKD